MTTTKNPHEYVRCDGDRDGLAVLTLHLCASHGHDWLAIQAYDFGRLAAVHAAEHGLNAI